jgi:hypothetical protein
MSNLDWFAQILLAGIFLFAGISKIFIFHRQTNAHNTGLSSRCLGLTRRVVYAIAAMEIVLSLALIVSVNGWLPQILPILAASGLALLMAAACIYHARRREFTAPDFVMLLLALFVIVGHVVV